MQSGAGYFRATKGGQAVKIDIKYSIGKTIKGWGGCAVCVCLQGYAPKPQTYNQISLRLQNLAAGKQICQSFSLKDNVLI